MRRFVLLFVAACSPTVEERLAELDEQATVDCGSLPECETRDEVEVVLACMHDNLVAGIPARTSWIVDLDPVAYAYAIDGAYTKVEGYYDDESPEFTETRCRDLEIIVHGGPVCTQPRGVDCDVVDEW